MVVIPHTLLFYIHLPDNDMRAYYVGRLTHPIAVTHVTDI
jgi:hypothetical protein